MSRPQPTDGEQIGVHGDLVAPPPDLALLLDIANTAAHRLIRLGGELDQMQGRMLLGLVQEHATALGIEMEDGEPCPRCGSTRTDPDDPLRSPYHMANCRG